MDEIDLNTYCRLCLKESFSLNNIYTSHSPSGDPVWRVLNIVYDLQICPDDGLPPLICSPCTWKMQEFNSYKENVHFAKAEIIKFLKEKSADSIGDCSSRENNAMSMESDSTNSVQNNEEIVIEEWQMPEELKREAMDVDGYGIQPDMHTDGNIVNVDNGPGSSEVVLRGPDLPVKQEQSEPLFDDTNQVPDRLLRTRKMDISASDVSNAESSDMFQPSDQDDVPSRQDSPDSVRHFKRKVVNCRLTAEDQMQLSAVLSDGERHSVANSTLERSDKYEVHHNEADFNYPSKSNASEGKSFTADVTKGSILQNGPISFRGRMINSVPEYSVENEDSNSGNDSSNETASVSTSLAHVFECEEMPDVVNNGSTKTREPLVCSSSTLPSTISMDYTSPCISVQRTSRDSIQEKQLKRSRKEGSVYEGICMLDLERFGITLEKETDDPGPGNKRGNNPEGERQPLEQNAEKDRHMQSIIAPDTSDVKLLGSLSTAVPENVTVLKVVASLGNPVSGPDNRKKTLEVDRKTELVDSDTSSAGSENEGSNEGDLDGENTVKTKPRMRHLCQHCGKVCSSYTTLWNHRKSMHGEKKFECKKCSKMFSLKKHLTQHNKSIHSEERPFSCTQCGSRFKRKVHLKKHMLVHSKKQMYQCVHCEMGFWNKWQHDNHQASHDGEVVWSCDGCKEKSNTWADYMNHVLEHKKNMMYQCDICAKAYNTKEYLKKHILFHIKPFECSVCGKHFGSREYLKNHMRVHTGEKPYECKVCGKIFSTYASRYNHMKMHSDACLFKCRHCCYSSKYKGGLKQHMRVHSRERPYACEVCGKMFSTRSILRTHMNIHSDARPFKCRFCDHRSNYKGNIRKHENRTHMNHN